jgi:hypothetical protein
MAKTATLINLIEKYPSAFADPEIALSVASPPIHISSSTVEEHEDDNVTDIELCQQHLLQIERDPKTLVIAASFLEELAAIVDTKQHSKSIQQSIQPAADDDTLNLAETYARQGTAECPGGMCPLDH